ncbi:helix-turn-helix transcriptional regulator [Phycicoccus sp. MAQZ13P-2]|uniref:helix-turn-helix transcriptional regulator n=1 Tax=Phycicoccus mangrovi TaxID=2840470 RepID=UPI001C0072B2|nr:helix-turn-helix transcriptional regulator [Phycicoccus mangrovi]MBT9257247.1 helix-turn-helix transcriptional regulator [Phycicoccus mangrovi]MBT9276184.1 helix-turn-helix transcriptional regulator [Phycicoccus mangrovi]
MNRHVGAALRLAERVRRLLATRDPALRPLGEGQALIATFEELEAGTTRSLWLAGDRHVPSTARGMRALNDRSRARGIEERVVFSTAHARSSPLLTTFDPHARIGPVPLKLLLLDERYLVVPGPDGVGVSGSACGTDDPDLVALGAAAFEETWARSVPWPEVGLLPPLPDRTFGVALLLLDGCSDHEIADRLGVSARTVSLEVRAVVRWLGARNRAHAVAMLVGAA